MPAAPKACPWCRGPVRDRPRHPRRFCSDGCRKSSWSAAHRHGARRPGQRLEHLTVVPAPIAVGPAGIAARRRTGTERTLRCGRCTSALGFVVDRAVIVLDGGRTVVQFVGAEARLSVICARCETSSAVLRLPAVAAPGRRPWAVALAGA